MDNGWLERILDKISEKRMDEQGHEKRYVTSPVFVYVLTLIAAIVFFVSLYNLFD